MGLFKRDANEPRLPGLAAVLELDQTGTWNPGQARVGLKLLVRGEGDSAIEVRLERDVFDTAVHLFVPGALIPVTVGPDDSTDVEIDWDGGWWPALEPGHMELVTRLGKHGRLELAVADPERVLERLLAQRGLEKRLEAA
jgi:hypothetical protein